MALPTRGLPIAVGLVKHNVADYLAYAAQWGPVKMPSGAQVSPGDVFLETGMREALQYVDMSTREMMEDGGIVVVIINGLSTPLALRDTIFTDGYDICQCGYPAITDGRSPSSTHVIPAAQPHPLDDTVMAYGVGAYAFAPMNSLDSLWAAIEFSGPPKPIGVTWKRLALSSLHFAVTADSSQYRYLEDFYNQTANNGTTVKSSAGADSTVYAEAYDSNAPYYLITVWVKPT